MTQPLIIPRTLHGEHILDRLRLRLPHMTALLQPDLRLDRLQLDSLDWVEFLCVVDGEFKVRLTQADLQAADTVANLAALIARRATPSGEKS